jgi:hypothetical protein
MFPLWNDVVAPVLDAIEVKRIVEVGALRGENTALMLSRLGPDAELHVIDPFPEFDPAEHEARFAGQYVFHRDLSVNVLGQLPPMDAALLDGDHNWYTVRTELQLLADVARRAGAPLPVCILHDVGWPYGRRDLYYDPSNIPEEHRQPWRRAGMRPGRSALVPGKGGLNGQLANAETEGGPRNGVLTGIEDFIAGHDRPLRFVFLPLYFGLGILVEEDRLAREPALASAISHLESPEGKDMLLRLGESIRIDAAVFDQAVLRNRDERIADTADLYLAAVVQAVLGLAPGSDASEPASPAHLDQVVMATAGVPVRRPVLVRGPPPTGTIAVLAARLRVAGGEPAQPLVWATGGNVSGAEQALTERLGLRGTWRSTPSGPSGVLPELGPLPCGLVYLATGATAEQIPPGCLGADTIVLVEEGGGPDLRLRSSTPHAEGAALAGAGREPE